MLPKYERLVEDRAEVLAVHFGLELFLTVWQKIDLDVGVTAACHILNREVPSLQHLHT